jgi:predicted KAP-like P-loop ATPase
MLKQYQQEQLAGYSSVTTAPAKLVEEKKEEILKFLQEPSDLSFVQSGQQANVASAQPGPSGSVTAVRSEKNRPIPRPSAVASLR